MLTILKIVKITASVVNITAKLVNITASVVNITASVVNIPASVVNITASLYWPCTKKKSIAKKDSPGISALLKDRQTRFLRFKN